MKNIPSSTHYTSYSSTDSCCCVINLSIIKWNKEACPGRNNCFKCCEGEMTVMSVSPHSGESLWQQENVQSNIESQYVLFLTGRLVLHRHRCAASQSATKSSFFCTFFFTSFNSRLSQVSEHHPTQQSTELHQTVSVNIWWCFSFIYFFPSSQRFAGSRRGKWIL